MAAQGGFENFKALIGTDEATLDIKGRISITTKKAMRLGEDFVAVLGRFGCLVLYPSPVWKALVDEVFRMPVLDPAREEFSRLVMGSAVDEISFDQQNRIVIPQDLRAAAKIGSGDKVKIVGCGDRVEIWSQKEWEKQQLADSRKYPDRQRAIEETYASIGEEALRTRRDGQEARVKENGA